MPDYTSNVCPRNSCAGGYGNCLDIKITNLCNANCSFCIEKDGYNPKKKASAVDLALQTVSKTEYPTVLILGGEPLTYADLIPYLKMIRPYKNRIYLTTNGTLLNSTFINLAKLGQYLDGINISIHHYDESKNDMVLRGGKKDAPPGKFNLHLSFRELQKAIITIKQYDCNVRINANLVKGFLETPADIKKMIQLTKDLGADEIRFSELQNSPKEFADAYAVFKNLPEDPYTQGCEVNIEGMKLTDGTKLKLPEGIRAKIKLTCGRVNPLRPPVRTTPKRYGQTLVLYPNAQLSQGWISHTKNQDNCHGNGCHDTLYNTEPGCHDTY